jgi:hypothetical protein
MSSHSATRCFADEATPSREWVLSPPFRPTAGMALPLHGICCSDTATFRRIAKMCVRGGDREGDDSGSGSEAAAVAARCGGGGDGGGGGGGGGGGSDGSVCGSGDVVVEIGSSYGVCTRLLADALGDAGRVVGVDTSKELIEASSVRCVVVVFHDTLTQY